MSNPSKQKGTKFETEMVRYLKEFGFDGIERRALTGTQDRGDLSGVPGWVIECKNQNTANWALWMDETERERRNDGADYGLLVVRRRMKPDFQSYAVLPIWQMAQLMEDDVERRSKLIG